MRTNIDKIKIFRCIECRNAFYTQYIGPSKDFICTTCSNKKLKTYDKIEKLFKEKF